MKIKSKKVIITTLLIIVMSIIFYMSHQPADDSSGMSQEVCRMICNVFVDDFESLSITEQKGYIEGLEFWVRKAAHLTEYMVLGVLLYLTVELYMRRREWIWGTSLIAGILYAISDEVHQYFVPGRSCEMRDVMIDSVGVLIGVIIIMVVNRSGKKENRK